jgi:putative heme-binding domain-containing protein
MPGAREAAAEVAGILEEPRNATDRWIPSGAVCAAARSDLDFLQIIAGLRPKPEVEKPLLEVVRAVAEHLARRPSAQAPAQLWLALNRANPGIAEAMLTGLATGWPVDRPAKFDEQARSQLAALEPKLSPGGVLQLTSLLKRWGLQDEVRDLTAGLRKGLLNQVADHNLAEEPQLAAARDLIALRGDKEDLAAVLDQITPQAAPSLTRGLLDAIGQATSPEVGQALVERWPVLTPAARSTALTILLRRPAWTKAMLAGLEKGQIDKSDLSIDQAQQLSRHPDSTIAAKAKKLLASGGRLPSPDRQKVIDALLPLAKRHGDANAGKLVFEKNCAKCHRFGAVGQTVGPDLTGIAVRDRADILTDILDPNRSVEGNYRQYTVETKNGLFLTGLLTAETRTVVELLDSDAQKHVIQRDDIESLISSPLSLMPEGFEKLPEEELVSLLDFLTAREKYLPLPLGKAATITSVRGMFYSRDSNAERLVFAAWGPHTVFGIPFQLIDPRGGSIPNAILLYGPQGAVSKEMPKSVSVPCNAPAKTIHLLSGVSGWGFPLGTKGSVSMIVRLHYADGQTEDHPLRNGVHFADYIRVVDVPESKLAFRLRGQQLRYLALTPKRNAKIEKIEFVKGPDDTAPLVMAVTVEGLE